MKSKVKIILMGMLCLISLSCITMGVTGCKDDVDDGTKINPLQKENCYEIIDYSDINNPKYKQVSPFYDDEYWYNVVYVGRVSTVPLDIGVDTKYYQGGKVAFSYTDTVKNTQTVQTSLTNTFSTTVGLECSVGFEYQGIQLAEVGASVSETCSQEYTVQKTEEYQTEHSETMTYYLESESEGFYRRTIFVDVDEFVIVRKHKESGELTNYSYSLISKQYFAWEYGETADFGGYTIDKIIPVIPEFIEGGEYYDVSTNGKHEKPYFIHNVEELKSISGTSKYYILANDIDIVENWQPISNFSGVLDGAGYSICYDTTSTNNNKVGLIANLNGGTIKNLNIVNSKIDVSLTAQDVFAGAVVGEITSGGIVSNCLVKNTTISAKAIDSNDTEGSARYCIVGAVVGKVNNGTVKRCNSTANSISGYARKHDTGHTDGWGEGTYSFVGGVVGELLNGICVNNVSKDIIGIKGETYVRVNFLDWGKPIKIYSEICLGGIIGRQQIAYSTQANNVYDCDVSEFVSIHDGKNDFAGGIDKSNCLTYKDLLVGLSN